VAARTEVTFREWDACVADGACDGYRPSDQDWGRETRPVINVTWMNARAYVAWLSWKIGKNCRLPNEAEREYAARAGTTTEFALPPPGGSDHIQGRGLAHCGKCGTKWNANNLQTLPVGQFPANAWGLYDMHGDVYEWVQDCRHDNYANAPEDGRAWGEENGGNCSYRVMCGGSFAYFWDRARSAFRISSVPQNRDADMGFRVACSSPSSGPDH
jgi:formylglycine-generating enzyme required for sulfatase activity